MPLEPSEAGVRVDPQVTIRAACRDRRSGPPESAREPAIKQRVGKFPHGAHGGHILRVLSSGRAKGSQRRSIDTGRCGNTDSRRHPIRRRYPQPHSNNPRPKCEP